MREIAELRQQGFDVTVLAARRDNGVPPPAPAVYRPRPLSIEALSAVGYVLCRHPLGVLRWLRLVAAALVECPAEAKTLVCNLHTVGAFVRALDRENISHVHACFLSWPACLALGVAAVAGVSLSIAAHARDVFVEPGALRLKAARARFIVACTREAADHISRGVSADDRTRLFVCRHGVDTGGIRPRGCCREPGGPDDDCMIACVGRLVPKKGHLDLLYAFSVVAARHPRCRLALIGSGPEHERLQQVIERLGLTRRVELPGWQTPEATKRLLEKAAVLVVPSVVAPDGDRDGIPNVILEAFAVGTPVVATRLAGIAEAVTDGLNGVLVEPGDIVAMADAIEALISDPRRWMALSGAALETAVQRFDLRKNVRCLAELFTGRCPGI